MCDVSLYLMKHPDPSVSSLYVEKVDIGEKGTYDVVLLFSLLLFSYNIHH